MRGIGLRCGAWSVGSAATQLDVRLGHIETHEPTQCANGAEAEAAAPLRHPYLSEAIADVTVALM